MAFSWENACAILIIFIQSLSYQFISYLYTPSIHATKPEIIAQVSEEMGIKIINGVLSADHVHIFAEIPPHISVSEFVKIAKGRSSRKIQTEFPEIRKQYRGRHFWARGFFSSTSGNITDEMINEYINQHSEAHKTDNLLNISLE